MRGLILISALALVHGSIDYDIDQCESGHANGKLLPHEDCTQFYYCLNGVLIPRMCPAGLFFDFEQQLCNWPKNTHCRQSQDDVEKEPENDEVLDASDPSHASRICASAEANGVLVAHEICNEFYKCFHGKPVQLTCPSNLLYNSEKKQCDWPQNVECGNRVIVESDESDNNSVNDEVDSDDTEDIIIYDDPSEAPAICMAEDSDRVLIAHENCNQFYKCVHGYPVAKECPLNLLYNPPRQYCDWPSNVDCGSRVILEYNDISNYLQQNNRRKRGVTDVESNVNNDPSEAPAICANENSDGELVAHENCNQFYKCSQGLPVALNCPANLLYNPEIKYCDWVHNVDCKDRLIPEPDSNNNVESNDSGNESGGNEGLGSSNDNENADPSEAPTICRTPGSNGVLVAHENCNQFYTCFNGLPVALTCPLKLLYHPSKKYCDWPEQVDCGDRVIPEPEDEDIIPVAEYEGSGDDDEYITDEEINDDPSKAPEICAAEGSDGILVAHEVCNIFYKCSGGLPVALECPGNLLYNPSKKYCDWPHEVDCGDRLLTEDEEKTGETGEKEEDAVQDIAYDAQAAEQCAHSNSNGMLVSHENCDQFYKCNFGVPVAFTCPAGLLYNPSVEVCDWPSNVECGARNKRVQTHKRYLEAKKALRFLLRVY